MYRARSSLTQLRTPSPLNVDLFDKTLASTTQSLAAATQRSLSRSPSISLGPDDPTTPATESKFPKSIPSPLPARPEKYRELPDVFVRLSSPRREPRSPRDVGTQRSPRSLPLPLHLSDIRTPDFSKRTGRSKKASSRTSKQSSSPPGPTRYTPHYDIIESKAQSPEFSLRTGRETPSTHWWKPQEGPGPAFIDADRLKRADDFLRPSSPSRSFSRASRSPTRRQSSVGKFYSTPKIDYIRPRASEDIPRISQTPRKLHYEESVSSRLQHVESPREPPERGHEHVPTLNLARVSGRDFTVKDVVKMSNIALKESSMARKMFDRERTQYFIRISKLASQQQKREMQRSKVPLAGTMSLLDLRQTNQQALKEATLMRQNIEARLMHIAERRRGVLGADKTETVSDAINRFADIVPTPKIRTKSH